MSKIQEVLKLAQPESVSSIDHAQRHGYFGTPDEWRSMPLVSSALRQ